MTEIEQAADVYAKHMEPKSARKRVPLKLAFSAGVLISAIQIRDLIETRRRVHDDMSADRFNDPAAAIRAKECEAILELLAKK